MSKTKKNNSAPRLKTFVFVDGSTVKATSMAEAIAKKNKPARKVEAEPVAPADTSEE